jgi:hypothetical protein
MKRLFLALLVLNLNACTTMHPVSIRDMKDAETPAEIRAGDRVEVVTRDNEKFEFAVTEINGEGLGGKFGFIPYQKMQRLSVRQPGTNADDFTWLWAVLGLALAVGLIANADSVSVCSPGPCPPQ